MSNDNDVASSPQAISGQAAAGAGAPSENEKWYSIADLPAGRLRVRVMWQARVFEACRMVAEGRGMRLAWCLPPRAGAPVEWLPRARDAATWAPQPEAWQPLDAATWIWPNGREPEPLRGCEPRMWSATQRFGAVDDAEAADLAREMEHDRAHFSGAADSRSTEASSDRSAAPTQWWHDPHAVTYSMPGMISTRETEGRFMRALLTERVVRVERPTANSFGSVLAKSIAQVPLTPKELAEQDPAPERWEPTGRDWDDMPVALDWRVALPDDVHQIVVQRSMQPPTPWAVIALSLGLRRDDLRALYDTAIERLADEANGRGSARGNHMRARWAAQREAIRAARRRER